MPVLPPQSLHDGRLWTKIILRISDEGAEIERSWPDHRVSMISQKRFRQNTGWKDLASYEQAFQRLLRDLRAEGEKLA